MRSQSVGQFRERVEIQQDSSAAGASAPDYSGTPKYRSVPCSITAISGQETWRGRQLEAHRSHVIECHFINDIRPTMRAKVLSGMYRGAYLNIDNVRPREREPGKLRTLELLCTEIPTQ